MRNQLMQPADTASATANSIREQSDQTFKLSEVGQGEHLLGRSPPYDGIAHFKRRMGWIGRRLRLLRAHGLIAKVSGTHRYVVTEKGRTTITALLTARKADVDQLTKLAA